MTTPTKRRIMRTFKLQEISAVDNPAQVHAKMVLMKRADGEESTMQKITSGEPQAFDTFDGAVAAIAKAEGVPHHEAMGKARQAYPELLADYQREGDERIGKAAEAAPRASIISKAELAFDEKVEALAKSRGIPHHAAMSSARQRYPEEFAAAYGDI